MLKNMISKLTEGFRNKDPSDDVQMVKNEFEERAVERACFESQWMLNMNFLKGNQYMNINPYLNTITPEMKQNPWEEREVYNHIAPIIETRLAKLGRIQPSLKARPATGDRDDINSAKVTVKLLETTSRQQKMKDKQLKANTWAETTGSVIWKTYWNPKGGMRVGFQGNEDVQSHVPIFEGEVQTDVISPFEIYPDSPFNEEISECQSIIHAKAYHVKDIKRIWGIEETPKEISVFSTKYSGFNLGGLGYGSAQYSIVPTQKKDCAMVYEYWERPSNEFPNGRLIICTDNNLLHSGDMPFVLGEYGTRDYPFIIQRCIESPGMFWGTSIIERLIPIQRSYNALRNRIKEHLARALIGNLVFEEGSFDEDVMDDIRRYGFAPGDMIPYRKETGPPTYLQTPPLPPEFMREQDTLKRDFIEISGVSEVSRDSSAPVGVKSGIALGVLQEQDDTRISLTAKNIEDSCIELGKKWIRLYRQFANQPRIAKFTGKNKEVEVLDWCSSDLTTDDLYIEASAGLSETPAQRRQMVFDLLDTGLFNDPETGALTKEGRSKVLEMLELGNWEDIDGIEKDHLNKAQREVRALLQGQEVHATSYDDDLLHISIHNRYRLSVEYEDLIKQNPGIEDLFEAHIGEHFENIQRKQAPPPMAAQPPMEAMEGGETESEIQ